MKTNGRVSTKLSKNRKRTRSGLLVWFADPRFRLFSSFCAYECDWVDRGLLMRTHKEFSRKWGCRVIGDAHLPAEWCCRWSPKCLHTEFTLTESPCQRPSNSVVVGPFHLSQADGCKMTPHYDFHLRFASIWKLSAFSHLLVIWVSTFCELPVHGLYPFLFRVPSPLIPRRSPSYMLHAHYLLITNCVYLCLWLVLSCFSCWMHQSF